MARKMKSTNQLTDRTAQIIGYSKAAATRALDAWSKCIQEAMCDLEKRFSDEEWLYLGKECIAREVDLLPALVPPGVVLEHLIIDNQRFEADKNRADLAVRIIGKLKKLSTLEAYALAYTLQSYMDNKSKLQGTSWWLQAERSRCLSKLAA